MALNLSQLGNSLGSALTDIGTYSAKAASQANTVSRQAQSAQGAFNQASANQANMLNDQSIQAQYGFNSAMMQNANEYNTEAWNQAAAWNEEMWERQAEFNAEQAQLNRNFNAAEAQKLRDWQTNMANTSYQRAMKDMAKAGLNPILAYSNGGANVPGGAAASGSAASVGGAQMSSASAQMASGGLLGANTASESNYMGQMEYLSGTLGLISAVIGGLSSAADAAGQLGETGKSIVDHATEILDPEIRESYEGYKDVKESNTWWDKVKNFAKYTWDNRTGGWIIDSAAKKAAITNKHSERDQFLRQNDINKSWNKYWKPKG